MGRKEEAFREWNRLLPSKTDDEAAFQTIAEAMQQEGLVEDAIRLYVSGRERFKDKLAFCIPLVTLYEKGAQFGKAAGELALFLVRFPRQIDYVENRMARFPVGKATADEVIDVLKRAAAAKPDCPEIGTVCMTYCLRAERFQEAVVVARGLERSADTRQKGKRVIECARRGLAAGDVRFARSAYQEAIDLSVDPARKREARLGLANCLARDGRLHEAVVEFDRIADGASNDTVAQQALEEKARIQAGSFEDLHGALESYRSLIRRFRNASRSHDWTMSIGDCLVRIADLPEADRTFRTLLQDERQKPDGRWIAPSYALARILFYQHRYAEALELLNAMTPQNLRMNHYQDPLLNDALELKFLLAPATGRRDPCLDALADTEWKARRQQWKDAASTVDSALAVCSTSPLCPNLLFGKAELLLQMHRTEDGRAVFGQFADRFPGHAKADRAMLNAGLLDEKMGRIPEAIAQYDRLLKTYPFSVLAEEARIRLQQLEKDR
jgi:tetratricopeptide (TPR) repeat protein